MKWGRILAATIAASVVGYGINAVSGGFFGHLYDPISGLWRAMSPTWVQNVIIATVAAQFLTVFAYASLHTGLGKKAQIGKKGLKFGLLVWLLRDIPGSLFTYVFMPVPAVLIGLWIGAGLIINLINGQVISRIYK